jgi:predicted kinase
MKKLYYTIGISGSGKSYYIKNHFLYDFPILKNFLLENNLELENIIVSPDNIRREICGDVNNHTKENIIWKLAELRTNNILNKYGYVLFDSTGTKLKLRHFTNKIYYDEKIALVFKANLKLSITRITNDINNNIDKSNVPILSINKQYKDYKNSVIKNDKWDGVWNKEIEKKAYNNLKHENFNDIFFI